MGVRLIPLGVTGASWMWDQLGGSLPVESATVNLRDASFGATGIDAFKGRLQSSEARGGPERSAHLKTFHARRKRWMLGWALGR